jgi:hypothetical protein
MSKFKQATLSIRKGAEGTSVTFHATAADGVSHTFDTTDFDKLRTNMMRELVVDYWCRSNGIPELYNNKG